MRFISADQIYPISSEPIPNGVVQIADDGEIIGVYSHEKALPFSERIEYYEGVIVPGFINAHCHLELSHMKGMIPEHTGLIPFISAVISQRESTEEEILRAMQQQDQEMRRNGIVAVGDISNKLISKELKSGSEIYYHTFVEVLGFDPARAEGTFQTALELLRRFEPLPASLAPHAPYSVSLPLMRLIVENNQNRHAPASIHMQECPEEDLLFRNKVGGFIGFYKDLGIHIDFFEASGKSSLQTVWPDLIPDPGTSKTKNAGKPKTLLVHNTRTTAEDIAAIRSSGADIYWCLCPNANLYIENSLPDISLFRDLGHRLTLGTDSLASNHQLNILSEMQTLKTHYPELSYEEMLRWATLNGAEVLQISHTYGSIEAGKRPGLNVIRGLETEGGLSVQPI